ncbi:hypothetical protein Gpo141_00011477 [Globisporangium polare]
MLRSTAVALAVACFSSVASAVTDVDAFDVPTFDFQQLTAASQTQAVLQALQADGIISLKNIPLYEQLRTAYLLEATRCALAASSAGDAFLAHKTLNDGTERFTITSPSGKALAKAGEETRARCPEYVAKYRAFSGLLESAVQALGEALDATPFIISSHESLTGTELMSESVHLDHFHAYEAAPTATASAQTDDSQLSLDMHTDNGILIAMTAPKYFDVLASSDVQEKTLAPYESGLLIQNRAGTVVRPVLKEDELVLMVGSGFQEWMNTSPSLRPVPHAMKYPRVSVSGERLIRAWFGKMVLLSRDTRMLNVGMSFGDYAARTTRYLSSAHDHDSGFASLACPSGRHLLESDEACVVRQCFPKPGKDPELQCSIQCNMQEKYRPGAERLCTENCDCTAKTNATAQYCWMLCVDNLPEDQCKVADQICLSDQDEDAARYIKDQRFVCKST